ncbi:MAG TPA: DUF502 domain-containing protein [Gemmatimonadaceae bacterium]|nr:DUF502 domain-containing protein [Gemmatimonadaceae bacterium]
MPRSSSRKRAPTIARRLLGHFLRGLVVVTPLAVTAYVVWFVLKTIDGWLNLAIPGLGLVITIAVITLIGFLASTVITRSALSFIEDVFNRLPFVRLLYSSTRDLLNAFVGKQKRFDQPVLVEIYKDVQVFGFVTQEAMKNLPSAAGDVAVYCPQSYNFAGQLLVVPTSRVTAISAASADVLAFIVSGGVTGTPFGRAIAARDRAAE